MKRLSPVDGFTLVEVALALGVAAFCLTAVFGLLPVGLNSNRASIEQTTAASVASSIVADLRSTVLLNPPMDKASPYYQITIPGTSAASPGITHTLFLRADGTPASSAAGPFQDQPIDAGQNPRYRAAISFTSTGPAGQSASVSSRNAVAARVLITWPATADPTSFAGSFETITTLIRN